MKLEIGGVCPDFTCYDSQNNSISRDSLKDKKVILFFYPKNFTPGCTKEVCDFRDKYNDIIANGYTVFGVSKSTPEGHKKFKESFKLPFELLADQTGEVCQAFGVWQEKSMFGKKYMGINRSTFIIDEKGNIINIWSKVSVPKHLNEVLKWISSN